MTPKYTCSSCGGSATVSGGKIERPCGHDTVAVLAHLQAHATGDGNVTNVHPFKEAFLKLFQRALGK